MDNLRRTLRCRGTDRIKIRNLCNARRGVNEVVNENALRWYLHVRKID